MGNNHVTYNRREVNLSLDLERTYWVENARRLRV